MTQPSPSPGNWYGLVRPTQGRYVAGVCAALGNATRTDPVLWRVVLAVLVCFGGIGALAYLALWVLTPEEGDTASPIQALLGRGSSQTSPVLAGILCVIGVLLLVFVLPRPLYLVLLGASIVLVVLLLANRSETGPAASPTGTPPGSPGEGGGGAPGEAAQHDRGGQAAEPGAAAPMAEPAVGEHFTPAQPLASESGPPPPRPYAATQPFAPHGPFGPFPPASPPRPPQRPRERSILPALTIFGTLILLGGLAVTDLTGLVSVPASGYVAAALAAVGAGLVVGAWLGRGRLLIAIGLVLVLALPAVHVASIWEGPRQPTATSITWVPDNVDDIGQRYAVSYGEGVLDLREVDFAGRRVELDVSVQGGEIRVLVPPEVSVTVQTDVIAGSVAVPGREAGGLVTDEPLRVPATVEPADGELVLDLRVRFGSIKVMR